jgi:LPS-assembly lipoprotein
MLSSDRGCRKPRRQLGPAALLAVVASLWLSACTVQPVYGSKPGGESVERTLRSIAIESVDSRVAQEVRNKLIFYLTGGGEVADPLYRMRLRVASSETALGINREGSAPVYSVSVTVSYSLTKIGSDDIILRETARGTASYDRSNQNFANIRAKLDAENRAAAQAADEVRIRVAAATAVGF